MSKHYEARSVVRAPRLDVICRAADLKGVAAVPFSFAIEDHELATDVQSDGLQSLTWADPQLTIMVVADTKDDAWAYVGLIEVCWSHCIMVDLD